MIVRKSNCYNIGYSIVMQMNWNGFYDSYLLLYPMQLRERKKIVIVDFLQ